MTMKGPGRDPIIFGAIYLEMAWRYTDTELGVGYSDVKVNFCIQSRPTAPGILVP